jgi:predicted alpha-1,2-mannosidase
VSIVVVVLGTLGLPGIPTATARPATDADLASWVDPMIGTWPPGFVSPGPVLPHGMVGLGPDTEGPVNYGGYYRHNALITGFSHTHMSTGGVQGGQIPMMPITGEPTSGDLSDVNWTQPVPAYSSPFEHATEVAEPGYYSVLLERYAVQAELTATRRAGMHRYTFLPDADAAVVLHVGRDLKGILNGRFIRVDDQTIIGSVDATRPNHTVFFAARFDRPVAAVTTMDGDPVAIGDAVEGSGTGAVVRFGGGGTVLAKVGISYVDGAGALGNLDAEIPGWDFDDVRAEARDEWNNALGSIEIEGGTDADRTPFYTALYHAQTFPTLMSDVDGRYRAGDDTIRTGERPHYSSFALWDSYRGQNQLLSVIDPGAYRDMVGSMLDLHRTTGSLPRWQLAHINTGSMSGDPALPFIAEAWCRGLIEEPIADELYNAMWSLASRRSDDYLRLGYLPVPQPSNPADLADGGPRETGTTLEFGVAEFALALVADATGRTADRDVLLGRSTGYRHMLDPETRWIRPRDASGAWAEPFAPELGYGFQEGTSWQYSWLAMHDLRGLFDLMGGDDEVDRRLDVFFSFPGAAAAPVVVPKAQNQATLFGIAYYGNQFAPGNEHDLQAPFLYNYAGEPWKTQAVARSTASLYTPTIDGLPGNDDLGALSGWLVWTMLGIYPMTPGAPLYVTGSPMFERAVVHRPGRSDLVIEAPGTSPAAKYVESATLGGEPLERAWLTEDELSEATLRLQMSEVPNMEWAAGPDAAPPSLSTNETSSFGCRPSTSVVEKEDTALTLTVEGEDDDSRVRARLFELDTPSVGIGGRTLMLYSDGELIGSQETDSDGIATFPLPRGHRGANRTLKVVFEGDDSYFGSSAERARMGNGREQRVTPPARRES